MTDRIERAREALDADCPGHATAHALIAIAELLAINVGETYTSGVLAGAMAGATATTDAVAKVMSAVLPGAPQPTGAPAPDNTCFFCDAPSIVDRPWGWHCTACGNWDVAAGHERCLGQHDGSGRCIESADHDGPCQFAPAIADIS